MTAPVMPPSSDPTSQILLKLGEMGVQLAVISEQLKQVQDHEARIRKLEAWRYGLPLTGLLAVASIVWTAYQAMRR